MDSHIEGGENEGIHTKMTYFVLLPTTTTFTYLTYDGSQASLYFYCYFVLIITGHHIIVSGNRKIVSLIRCVNLSYRCLNESKSYAMPAFNAYSAVLCCCGIPDSNP